MLVFTNFRIRVWSLSVFVRFDGWSPSPLSVNDENAVLGKPQNKDLVIDNMVAKGLDLC